MNKIKLGDVMDVKRGTSLSGDYYSTSGDLVRLTLGNFKYPDCGFKPNTAKDDIYFVGEVKPEYIMKKGDIITPLTEQVKGLLGNTATIPESDKYIQSGDIGKIIPDESMIDKRFSYYLVSSPTVKKQLSAASQQTKIRHTSPDKIKDCIAFIPDLYQQKKIAHLLDTINLLIQTNDSAIKQLESMAKTIYDYWFLQFEFPNEDGKPYKSSGGKMVWNDELKREIPEGWKVKSMSENSLVVGGTPNRKNATYWNGQIPWLTTSEINNSIIEPSKEFITEKGLKESAAKVIGKDSLIVAMYGLGTAGRVGYLTYPSTTNQACCSISCSNKLELCFLYFFMKNQQKYIDKIVTGSIQKNLNKETIGNFIYALPSDEVLKKSGFENYLAKMIQLTKENQELASLRDFLLPLLMNGQVTFKEDE